MGTTRLEAFSDAVIAIILTIMVLEFKVPHQPTLEALKPLWPAVLSYILSFVFLGIYWNNHHHMLHATKRVTGGVLWANSYLLFWLSLVPFVTDWMGENHFAAVPMALYGFVLLMSAIAYTALQATIVRCEGPHSVLAHAVGKDAKGKISMLLYVLGIAGAAISPWISGAMYVAVACIWLVPDRRIERQITHEG